MAISWETGSAFSPDLAASVSLALEEQATADVRMRAAAKRPRDKIPAVFLKDMTDTSMIDLPNG
jgi:hypothetical protein